MLLEILSVQMRIIGGIHDADEAPRIGLENRVVVYHSVRLLT
jgi:hypothetical protein